MLELKYHSYDELPIKDYIEMRNIIESEEEDYIKDFMIISILTGIEYENLLEYNLEEIRGITNKCRFLQDSEINVKKKLSCVTINGIKYNVCHNMKDFTVAQYVDFQQYPKDEKHLAENLSTFLIPDGKKYAEGYDIAKTISDFNEYMDISTAVSLQNFFTKKLVTSIRTSIRFLVKRMKWEMRKNKSPEITKKYQEIKALEQKYGYLL